MTSRRILVVDDYVPAANAVAQLLRIAGHAVTTLHSAERVLEMAIEFQPDIVFLDIGLRGEDDGVAVARWLRDEPRLDGLLLVAMTGRWDGDHDERIANAGFDYYLVKPVGFDELDAIIATAHERTTPGTKGQ